MCLIVFAYKVHEDYPLILAGNRDEFYNRPAQKAHFWYEEPALLAGKDLKAGGTWMGITKNGRFAAITNFRDMSNIKKDAPSRGDIVKGFLTSSASPLDYLSELKNEAHRYNGFNLIAGNIDNLYYLTNQQDIFKEIEPGYHAISNAYLDTPWPKTETALQKFKTRVDSNNFNEPELFNILAHSERYPDKDLPETGLPLELERAVSSIFISTEDYGSRCSTLLYALQDGTAEFAERTFNTSNRAVDQTLYYTLQT